MRNKGMGIHVALAILFMGSVFYQGCDHLPGDPPQEMTLEAWERDFEALTREMVARNIALADSSTARGFEREVQKSIGRLSGLTHDEIVGELFRLVAGIQSGHSHVELLQKPLDFKWFPFVAYDFDDGLRIIAASSNHESIVGSKILEINGHSIESVRDRLVPFMAVENEHYRKYLFPLYLATPNMLRAAGVTREGDDGLHFVLEGQGEKTTITIDPGSVRGFFSLHSSLAGSYPLELGLLADRLFYQEYDPATRTLVVRCNQVLNDGNELFASFVREVQATIEKRDIDRFVLDLRFNSGGNNLLGISLATMIKKSLKINQSGKLFVLVGRQTFSAAVDVAMRIQRTTKAILIGEAMGGAPNSFGESVIVTLPNSKIRVALSTRRWVNGMPGGTQPTMEPDIRVSYTYVDFVGRRDPAMAAVAAYSPPSRTWHKVSNESLAAHEGTYQFHGSQKLVISKSAEGLYARIVDFEDFLRTDLHASSETTFEGDLRDFRIRFVRGPGQQETNGVVLSWCGIDWEATRTTVDHVLPWDLLQRGEVLEGSRLLRMAHGAWLDSRIELHLNNLGYALLGKNEYASAIEVLDLNVSLFPLSANTYDSLGEAHLLAGDKARAEENYKWALALNPENDNARDALKKLTSR